ncbi:regulator of G-protein signaling 12-like isoform X2 [Patiria miniata]|uniref:Uncharacterized protein n=1 Tax=Patiria miniata TaxID=46514 RepID=A0A914B5T4_PATMI|nr:regulator of G-protein signaling 12-like isoform X2 [Patiria miniata]
MHPGRRSKTKLPKTSFSNLKTVEVGRGRNGYGFTMTGQYPCVLSSILPGSPADIAGLKSGDCVMAVDGENVTRVGHEQIIKLIGSTSGVLRLTVACLDESESSDEEYVPPPRVRYSRSKSTPPNADNRDELERDELKRGIFHEQQLPLYDHRNEHLQSMTPTGPDPSSKFSPGHLSPYNQTGKAKVVLQKPASGYDYTYWNGRSFEKIGSQKPRRVKRHAESKQRQRAYSTQSHTSFFAEEDEADQGLRPLTPVEVSNIRYPSLRPNSRQTSRHPRSAGPPKERRVIMHAVVGYLGSIDIPASANLPTASLQAIRGCVRRLHLEQRVHSLMLMEITNMGVELVNANHKVTVVYPSDSITFSGICPDDRRCFGIVTAQSQAQIPDSLDSDEEPIGSSCHVFLVDPSLNNHSVHAQMAARFGIQCVHDDATNSCRQFPTSSKPLLMHIAQLHRGHSDRLHFADFYGQSAYPAGPRRSNSNSSNSDSGFGNGKENGTEANQHGERVMIVDVAGHIRNQRTRGQSATSDSSPNRHVVHAEINTSQSSYSMSSASPSSPENSPQNTFNQKKMSDPSGRLTPRARPDPILRDRNGSVTPLARPSSAVFNTASGRLTPRARPDPVGFCSPLTVPTSNQYRPPSKTLDSNTNQNLADVTNHMNVHLRNKPGDVSNVSGRPPTGRHSLYAKLDAGPRSSELLNPNKKAEAQKMTQLRLKIHRQHDLTRRNSDCSEYSSSNLKMSQQRSQRGSQLNIPLNEAGTRQSLAASDGELDAAEGESTLKSETNRSNPNLLEIGGNQEVGRVSSWAVSFDHLLQDELGLACFTEFLKREFSEENIMFWIACETMSKMTKKDDLKRMSQHIYSKHLSDDSSMPVNLDSSCASKVTQCLKNPTPDMFKAQQQQIFQLMKYDSYSRFLKNQVYQDCVLAEMAGNPLPVFCRQRSDCTGSVSSTDEATGDRKKAAQKGNKKKYQIWKTTKSYSLEVCEDSPDKKRKSILPWNKAKVTRKTGKDFDPSADSEALRQSGNGRNHSSKASSVTSQTGQNGKAITMEGTCRLVFPNDDEVVLPARQGFTVRDVLTPHLDVRHLNLQSVETFRADTKEIVDYRQDMSAMAGADIVVEQRVVFKMELPSHRVIGVKSKPTKKLIEVLRPVTHKYNLQLDALVVHLSNSPVPLDLDITVASLDGQKILIETLEQYGAGNYQARARVDPAPVAVLHKAASDESIIRKQDARPTQQAAYHHRRLSQNEFARGDKSAESEGKSGHEVKGHEVNGQVVTLRPSNSDTSIQTMKSQHRSYRLANSDADELYSMLSKAQRRRMDDQRGLTIRNLELPDFLKKPKKDTASNRPQSALGTPYQKYRPGVSQSSDKSKKFKDRAVRCKSTPPATYKEPGLGEGFIPSHVQAEAIFGGRGRSSDITPLTFNDSMMAVGDGRYDFGENLDMIDYAFGYDGVAHNNDFQANQYDDKFSPRAYNTDPFVAKGGDRGLSLEIYDGGLGNSRHGSEQHGSHPHGNQHRGDGDYDDVFQGVQFSIGQAQEYDLDRTLTKSTSGNESILPPPPDELDYTLRLEEANYSPPPPVIPMNQDQMTSLAHSGRITQGSTLPGHMSDLSNQPLTDTDSVHFGDSPLLDDPLSPRIPSPSTHDLVMTPNPEEDFDHSLGAHGPFYGFHPQEDVPQSPIESHPSMISSRPDVLRPVLDPENISSSQESTTQQGLSQYNASSHVASQYASPPVSSHQATLQSFQHSQQGASQGGASQDVTSQNVTSQNLTSQSLTSQSTDVQESTPQLSSLQASNTTPKPDINLQWKAANRVQQQKIDRDKWETVVKDGRTMRATFV